MKNIFENAEIELVFFEACDVLTTSGFDEDPTIKSDGLNILGPGTEQQHE